MSLYTAETRRLTKRRFTRFFVLGVLVVLAAIAVVMFFSNEKATPRTLAVAETRAEEQFRQDQTIAETERKACEARPGEDCTGYWVPTREDYKAEQFLPPSFDFREEFGVLAVALAALLAVMAFVIGATFVGAEWSSGGMMNLLLWRPQRLKVLGTKLGALLVALTGLTVVVSAAWTGFFALTASLRGSLDSMTSGAWQSFLLMELRGLAVVLVAGVIGFGLASIGRHTAVAMGVAIGVVVLFQFGLGTVLSMAGARWVEAYLIPTWLIAWMDKSYEISDWSAPCVYSPQGCEPPTMTITWPMAGGVFAAVLAVVIGTAMWTMRNRDIT
ncbi:ABC transporter permease subunit [Actinoplanes sp. NPDC051346]|uniref:ABC transporter permease subunit n=1 Tax=Actinoplanes sp. NPDC051346 TaxID=3155048 RepID=UPI003421889B